MTPPDSREAVEAAHLRFDIDLRLGRDVPDVHVDIAITDALHLIAPEPRVPT